ncbi:hypothetical protein KI387_041105, partial [Taxus chinensis]
SRMRKSSLPYAGEEMIQYTKDGTVDRHGRQAIKARTGGWRSAVLILVNQGFATLAFFGVGVNLVLFLTRVLKKSNASAANNVSLWTGTVYMFSLVGAFLSDSYIGRYRTCTSFLFIFVGGLILLALSSQLLLLKPSGCGDGSLSCEHATPMAIGVFYLSIYLVALGNGGYQPSIATFGADQFDEEDEKGQSKVAFFSWFYLALNLGSLFSNTVLGYFEDNGMWPLGFWMSALAAIISIIVFLIGTPRYRHHMPGGNPLPRIGQVFVAATRKWRLKLPSDADKLHELPSKESAINGSRKILHSAGFSFMIVTVQMSWFAESVDYGLLSFTVEKISTSSIQPDDIGPGECEMPYETKTERNHPSSMQPCGVKAGVCEMPFEATEPNPSLLMHPSNIKLDDCGLPNEMTEPNPTNSMQPRKSSSGVSGWLFETTEPYQSSSMQPNGIRPGDCQIPFEATTGPSPSFVMHSNITSDDCGLPSEMTAVSNSTLVQPSNIGSGNCGWPFVSTELNTASLMQPSNIRLGDCGMPFDYARDLLSDGRSVILGSGFVDNR